MATNTSETVGRYYGIDFGTTYSCISYIDEYGRAEVVTGENQSFALPSIVLFESADRVIIGQEAKNRAKLQPDRVIERVKRFMGTDWSTTQYGRRWSPEEIAAEILKRLAEWTTNHNRETVRDVVITVPAYFNFEQRNAIQRSGVTAGFNVHALVNEPTAAAISYGKTSDSNLDETVLVYDLGGGTFDTTVININAGDITVICSGGDGSIGGRLWDERLIEYFKDSWQRQHGNEDILEDNVTHQTVAEQAEQFKRSLTSLEANSLFIQHRADRTEVDMTRDNFDHLTADLLTPTILHIEQTMRIAREKGYPIITKILLVGGSSYMTQVKREIENKFGLETLLYQPDQAVAKGAAYYARDIQIRNVLEETGLDPGDPDILKSLPAGITVEDVQAATGNSGRRVVDVASRNFGSVGLIPGSGSDAYAIFYLIYKNSQVPSDIERYFVTTVDNQRSLEFSIVESNIEGPVDPEPISSGGQGDDRFVLPEHATKLGHVYLNLPDATVAGTPVTLRFRLSEDGGRLLITATLPTNGDSVDLAIIV
jgi:molecular chaperone DnaK (HSP70)